MMIVQLPDLNITIYDNVVVLSSRGVPIIGSASNVEFLSVSVQNNRRTDIATDVHTAANSK